MKNLLQKVSVFILALSTTGQLLAQDSWVKTVNGFGLPTNNTTYGMTVYNGEMYAAVGPDSGYVYKTSTGNPNDWTRVFSHPTSLSIQAINSTPDGGGNIYIASQHAFPDSTTVFRSTNGISWSPYYMTGSNVKYIMPYKGSGSTDSIYIVESNFDGDIVLKSWYNSNDPSNIAGAWDTTFRISDYIPSGAISAIGKYGTKLFVGTGGAELFSTADGTTWLQNLNVGNGFGDPNNKSISAIASFGGSIYLATENNAMGAQIWKSGDEVSWTMVQQLSPFYTRINSLSVADGKLWYTASSFALAGMVGYTSDGTTFLLSNTDGFGDANNDGNNSSITGYGNNVYWSGHTNGAMARSPMIPGGAGAQIWRKCTLTPPVVDLGPDQTVCDGSSVTLSAGSGGANYWWSNDARTQTTSITAPAMAYVQYVGVNGCSDMDTVNLNTYPGPSIMITNPMLPYSLCSGTPVNITGSVTSNVYNAPSVPIHKTAQDTISYFLSTTFDTIPVSGVIGSNAGMSLVSVTIDSINHPVTGDLSLDIISPSGSAVNLSFNNGGAVPNGYYGTEFRMDAAQSITTASAPYTGQYIPAHPFNGLSGNPNGNWVLQVVDINPGDDGNLKGWSIRFRNEDTVLTYSWTPATGLSSVSTLNTTATPAASTTYTLSATNSIGCASQMPVELDVPHLAFTQDVDTVCYFGSLYLQPAGATASTMWSPATGLSSTSGTAVFASPTTSTEYYITDTIFGCAVSDSILLNINPQITLTSPPTQNICHNDTAVLTASATGGIPPYTFYWNSLTGQTITPQLAYSTSYSLSVTDAAGCGAFASAYVNVSPSTDIYGHVSYSGGSVNTSDVVLYKYLPFLTQFDTVMTTTTDASGDYHFPLADHSNYLIEVFPAAAYTTLVPSYYGTQFLWDSATVVSHNCAGNDTFNIVMVEETPFVGPGFLQGSIHEDYGFGLRIPGDPIPGVDVKLGRNPGGALVTCTQTDTNGTYSFSNVAYGNYTIYADIPGLGRDSSYTVTLSAADSNIVDLNYLVDSTVIFIVDDITTGIKPAGTTAGKESYFNVYPNPSKGIATIEYSLADDAKVSLGIYNVLGVKVVDLENTKQMAGIYKYSVNNERSRELTSGVYFVTLIVNGKTNIHRLIITE